MSSIRSSMLPLVLLQLLASSLTVLHASGLRLPPSPPWWGGDNPLYTVSVNMTNPSPAANWTFQYTYNGLTNASLYEHPAPQYDEMCADQPYGSEYSCHVLFAADGWSYITFPSTPQGSVCCQCENMFGSTLYDWMQDGEFVGHEHVNGLAVQHWQKWGNELNHYYVTDDAEQAAVRYFEMWSSGPGSPQEPKAWDFNMATLKTGPTAYDPAKLMPPSSASCPLCTNDLCKQMRTNNAETVSLL